MLSSKTFLNLLLASVVVSIAACTRDNERTETGTNGSTGGGAATGVSNVVEEAGLQGTYTSVCDTNDLLQTAEKVSVAFSGNKLTQTQTFFGENNCSEDPIGQITYEGEFRVANQGEANQAKQIDVTISKVTVMPQKSALTKVLNELSFCGKDNYEIGKPVDVSSGSANATCVVSNVPETRFGSYSLADNQLYFSADTLVDLPKQENERKTEIDREESRRYTR